MDKTEQLKQASQTDALIMVIVYADWSPHYEWLEPTIREYAPQIKKVIKVNIEGDKDLSDLLQVYDVPTFILMRGGEELWKRTGELTPEELNLVLQEFAK